VKLSKEPRRLKPINDNLIAIIVVLLIPASFTKQAENITYYQRAQSAPSALCGTDQAG